jgi:hypothetical protein
MDHGGSLQNRRRRFSCRLSNRRRRRFSCHRRPPPCRRRPSAVCCHHDLHLHEVDHGGRRRRRFSCRLSNRLSALSFFIFSCRPSSSSVAVVALLRFVVLPLLPFLIGLFLTAMTRRPAPSRHLIGLFLTAGTGDRRRHVISSSFLIFSCHHLYP